MVIDSLPMADQDEERERRTGAGKASVSAPVALAALCATLLALTCAVRMQRSYVVSSKPGNPFVGEWHTEFTTGRKPLLGRV